MSTIEHKLSQLAPRHRFAITGAYLIGLYASLPFTRDFVLSLKELHLLPGLVTGTYLAIAAAVVWLMLFLYRIRDLAAYALMSCVAIILGYFVLGLEVPEERVHFVQFGLLAIGVCYSLRPYMDGRRLYLGTFAVTAAAGGLDEVIQRFLPSRVFDWRDIGFNVMAAGFGATFCWIFRSFLVERVEEPSTDEGSA